MKLKSLLIATLLFCGMTLFAQAGNDTTLKGDAEFPLTDPYDGLVTVTSIPNGVCDWVKVVLRSGTGPETAVDSAIGFLLYDGSVVASDGVSDLAFENAAPGSYYAVIYTRNNLAVMSAVTIDISTGSASYDFTDAVGRAYGGAPAMVLVSGVYCVPLGDVNVNKYVNTQDIALVKAGVIAGASGYEVTDVNYNTSVNIQDVALTKVNAAAGFQSYVP